MNLPADLSTPTSALPLHPTLRQAVRSPRRRRPTGAAPPLPYRLRTSGIGWLVAALVLIGLTLAIFARGLRGPAVAVTVVDDAVVGWLADLVGPGLVGPLRGLVRIGSWWVLGTLYFVLLLVLLVLRRWRHLIVWVVASQLGSYLILGLATIARRPRPFGVELQSSWGGWAMPSVPVAFLAATLMSVLYTLVPEGRWRNLGKWVAAALITVVATARVALGVDAPTDVLVGVGIGVAFPLLAFRRFTPNEVAPITYRRGRAAHLDVGGARGQAIRRALADQLGLVLEEVKPFGLAGSAGSTPLRITVKGNPPRQLFGKLYAQSHLRSDRWYKLGRELLYGRLEDEKPFNSVRRLVQQEDYALSLMQRAGLPSPVPFGFVELTPEREYLLVAEFLAGTVELGEAEVTDQVIDDGLRIIRRLWDAGLAHRDIKPANLLVRDGHLLLIDVAFVEARPSPWRQAVDLANMMLCLALRSSPERVYRRALRFFTVEEITEAFAPLRLPGARRTPLAALGLALPSQLRHLLRAQGGNLYAEFVRLLPSPPRPIRMQRWSARRVGLWAAILAVLVLATVNSRYVLSTEDLVETPLGVKDAGCADLEPLWLMAQSVPSASLVPCLQLLPVGWSVAEVAVNNGRSVITLDHDRAGTAAMRVELTAACDLTGATEVTSEHPEALRYVLVDRASRAYKFSGGCVTQRFTAAAPSALRMRDTAATELGFTTRAALQAALSVRSDGRLQLDP
jgi:tRNA A-37 threonylcarbamoyl transferase component Bud32/membrane-associated phospholipid phosphatase